MIYYYSNGVAMTWPPPPVDGVTRWHDGLSVRTELVSLESGFLAVDLDVVIKHLRVVTGAAEDDLIIDYIRTATELAEYHMQSSVRPQRLALVSSGVPASGVYELAGDPVREVVSIDYYDGDNVVQTLSGSPAPWLFLQGTTDQPSTVQAPYGESWPSVVARPDAVRLTYDAGYATAADVPHRIRHGIILCVTELYENRGLSNDMGNEANLLDLGRFWPRRW